MSSYYSKGILKKFPGGKIFVTADIVAYGSFTWGSAVNALGNRDASWTKHSRKQWFHFIMSSKNGNKTRLQTYIAALQRVIASKASCLLLFGGGTFELLAFNDYYRVIQNSLSDVLEVD